MKTPSPSSRRGVALLAVLAIIVLITALIVGLLLRAGTERSASASYSATTSTQQLADNTINLVQAQINDATSQANSAWASQPGAIRVFDTSGALTRIYRLYSGTSLMITADFAASLAADIAPTTWSSQPANWVDINAPSTVPGVTGADGNDLRAFPILDPRDPSDPSQIANLGGGFTLTSPPGATSTQPAPMPVRWLYVLKQGNIIAPVGSGSAVTVTGATAENPIVGRIAFWTDDETAKVNINTAGDGSFWDVPRFGAADDITTYARNQPAAGEYQRFPGHPATTSLRPILESLGFSSPATSNGTQSELFKLLPRYNDDRGSKAGTVTPSGTPTPKSERLYPSVGEMLYSGSTPGSRSASALNRQQVETAKFFLTAQSRAPEVTLFGTPRVSVWPVDSSLANNPLSPRTSPYDRLSAFASTVGGKGYYFQRSNADSPTADYTGIARNQNLYGYLQSLTAANIPGFGGNFLAKYPATGTKPSDRDQILTEMADYIRLTNLYDATLDPSGTNGYQFTDKGIGHGQVAPLRIGATQGIGRFYTISEMGVLVICTADGSGIATTGTGAANDARSVSNLATPTKLKNTAGTDVGIDYTATGADFPANPTLADVYGGTKTALMSGQKRLQAMFVFELASPMLGFANIKPDAQIRISGLQNIQIGGLTPFPSDSNGTITMNPNTISTTSMGGGVVGMRFAISLANDNSRVNGWSNRANANAYPFVSNPFTVSGTSISLSTSGTVKVEILLRQNGGSPTVVQTFNVQFPSTTMPTPELLNYGVPWAMDADGNSFTNLASDWWGFDKRIPWASEVTPMGSSSVVDGPGAVIRAEIVPSPVRSPWRLNASDMAASGSTGARNLLRGDVVRTIVSKAGDYRISAAAETVDADPATSPSFQTGPLYTSGTARYGHIFTEVKQGSDRFTGVYNQNILASGVTVAQVRAMDRPDVPGNVTSSSFTGDWDTGLPLYADGAYANKPDEGNVYYLTGSGSNASKTPYYSSDNELIADTGFFTPNRIIPSPAMFGSLPTKVGAGIPWRTLLFRPSINHPATGTSPKDHLFLDLFTMPVVEPYAISEPFSTAGKVNMNYRIVPFTYINRNTGIRAVLAGERIAEVGATDQLYKSGTNSIGTSIGDVRKPLNLSETDGTLRQFKERFDSGDIFRSPSEICDIYLVPSDRQWTSDTAANSVWYGADFALVGDNVRERPYANIYPRLTTKSNSYTVFYTVQALKNPSATPAQWTEGKGVVLGQARGSAAIERYLAPDSDVPDYATSPSANSIDHYYRWRILNNRLFAP